MKKITTHILLLAAMIMPLATWAQSYQSVPYSTGFEGLSTGSQPTGWIAVQSGMNGSNTFPSAYSYAPNTHSGSVYYEFEFSSSSAVRTEVAATCEFANPQNLMIDFWAATTNANCPDLFEVGVVEDDTLFVPVDTVTLTNASTFNNNSYYHYTVFLTEYSGTGHRIGFRARKASGQLTLFLDDMTIDNAPGCAYMPGEPSITTDSNSATMTWSAPLVTMGYMIYITNDSTWYNTSTNSYTFTGLNANTQYSGYLYNTCDGTDSSMGVPFSFRTACGMPVFPLVETMEGYSTSFPSCWNATETSGSYPSIASSGGHNGGKALDMGSNNSTVSFASPYLYAPINTFETKFWARKTSDYYDVKLSVGYVTHLDSIGNAVMLDTFDLTNGWVEYNVSFGNIATSDNGYIIYRKTIPSYNYYSVYIDDITIRNISSCATPQNLRQTGTAAGTVNLAWDDSAAYQWEVVYGPAGIDPDTVVYNTVTFYSDTVTVSGLQDTITYDFYVRAVCSEYSYWQGPLTVRPNLYVMTANHSDTVYMCGGTIADDGGLDGNYSYSQNSTLVIYPNDNTQTVRLSGSYSLYNYSYTNCGTLTLYEGVGTTGRVLGTYSNSTDSLNVVSQDGAITIKFTSSGYSDYYTSSGYMLNVSCEPLPSCNPPYDVEITDVSGSSAVVNWSYGNSTTLQGFTVTVIDTASGYSSSYTVADTVRSYQLGGLTQTTTYLATVAAICDGNENSNADSAYFTTNCYVGGEVQIGDGNVSLTSHPFNSYYNYTICQVLYSNTEMASLTDTIFGIKLYQISGPNATRTVAIYIDTTSTTALNSGSDFVVMDSTKLVFSGTTTFHDGWNEFMFTSPWVRPSTTNNIVLTFDDNTGSWTSSTSWQGTGGQNGKTLCTYNDVTNYDPSSSSTSPGATPNRPNVIFVAPCGDASCVAPNITLGGTTSNSITVNWVPGMNETSWTVEYRIEGDNTWTADIASTSAQTHTITGLYANTTYFVRVGSLCSGSTDIPYNQVSARTACDMMSRSTLPINEGFEGYNTGDMPNCWIRTATGSSGSGVFPSCYNYSSNARTGNVYFEMEADNGGTEIFAMPAIDTINGLALDFYVATTSSYAPTALELGVLESDTHFVTIDTIDLSDCTSLYSYVRKSVLVNYNGTGNRIAFRATKNSRYTVFLDDFSLYVPNPCDSVRAITIDSIGLNYIAIHWTDTNYTGSYTVRIATSNNEAAAFDSAIVTSTSHTFTGLSFATTYYIFVYANCLSGMSDMNMVQATTSCDVIATFPWSEDFENFSASSTYGDPMQQCWNRGSNSTYTAYPYLYNYYNHTAGGNNSIYMYTYYDCWLALPEMEYIDSLILKFYMLGPSPSYYTYQAQVGVMSSQNNINTFIPLDTLTYSGSGNDDWQLMRVDLSGAPDSCRFICIRTFGSDYGGFYIDDISLNYDNGCAELENLVASAVGMSTATINWTDTSNNGSYVVSISTTNNIESAFLTDTATTNSYTFTGLNPVSTYYVWVYNNCPNGTSDIITNHFTTLASDPHFLPYYNDFEDSTNTFTVYQRSGSNTWHIGSAVSHGGSHCMYVTNDGGTTNAYTNSNQSISFAMTYLQIPYDSSYAISYDWRCQGEGTYDLMRIALVPEDYDFSTSFTAINRYTNTLPTGWIALDGGKRNLRNTWQNDENSVLLTAGNYYLTIVWVNDGAMGSNPPAAIDNISFTLLTCPAPSNLVATATSSSSIDVDWDDGAANTWVVEYGVSGFSTGMGTVRTVTTSNITLTSLAPTTAYDIYVRPVCGISDTGFTAMTTCLTGCDSVITEFPWVEDFENGISCWNQYYQRGDVAWTTGRGGNAYGGMTGAASGQYNARFSVNSYNGYTTYLITPVLDIQSDDEVMMTFFHAQPAWGTDQDTMAVYYRVSPDSSWNYIASWNNNIPNWQLDTVMLPNTSSTYQVAFMAHSGFGLGILLDSIVVYGSETCTRPVVANTNVGPTSVAVTWTSPANSFDVAIKPASAYEWPEATRVTTHNYTFTGLEPNTHYNYRIRSICSDTSISFWATRNCITDTLTCYVPEGLTVVDVDFESVTVSWNADASGHSVAYVVSVFNTVFNSSDTVYSNFVTIDGLYPALNYNVQVQAMCSSTTYSDWCSAVPFTTASCHPVNNVAVDNITATSARVSWTPGGEEESWTVNYGYRGFTQGSGNSVTVNTPSITIMNLEPETDYDIYVRAACSENVASNWSEVHHITTLTGEPDGIEAAEGEFSCTIYPNPATDATTISVCGVNGKVSISIADINGRTVATETLECSAECAKHMTTSNLAQGTYFVRIVSDNVNMVRKLVVH